MIINSKVEQVLRQDQAYRDSDKKLLIAIWWGEGLHLTQEQIRVFMDKCTSAETITRARRVLKGKYPASEKVDNQRFQKYLEHRFNRVYSTRED